MPQESPCGQQRSVYLLLLLSISFWANHSHTHHTHTHTHLTRKVIKEVRWPGWVWAGECFFWYQPTRVIPDKRPLNGCCCCCCCCCPGLPGWTATRKEKSNLDFTKARDSECQWYQLGHMQVCTLLQTNNHASTPLLSFLQAGCPSCHLTNSVKALKAS